MTIDDPDNKPGNVIFAVCVEARHLSSFAAEQHATIVATAGGDAFNDAGDSVRRELAGGNIVEKEKWARALDQNIVHAVVDQVATDCVVIAGREGDFQLGADAVGRRHQNRRAQVRKGAVKHSAEATNV